MTKILKRPLSIILAVLMVMSLFVAVPVTANAEDYIGHYSIPCSDLQAGDTIQMDSNGDSPYIDIVNCTIILKGGRYATGFVDIDNGTEFLEVCDSDYTFSNSGYYNERQMRFTVDSNDYSPVDENGHWSRIWYVLDVEGEGYGKTVTLGGYDGSSSGSGNVTPADVEQLLNSMNTMIDSYMTQGDQDNANELIDYFIPLFSKFNDAGGQVTDEVKSAYYAALDAFIQHGGTLSGGGNNPASSLAFTKVTDASQIADDNISTCTKSEAKAWIKANWDDIMSNAGSGQYASFGFLYHHANGDLYHIGFPKDIEDNDFDNMVDEQSVSLTPVGEGEGLSLSVVIDWYQNDGDNYTPYICTGAGSSAGSVFNGTYPNANNVYINTGGAPTEVTIADLEVGDVIISSPSGHMSVSKGDCTIILAGGTVGDGDPNMGELMDVYDDDATLNGSVNFSFNDEFGYARIVDMSNNYKDYYAVYNNSLGNSFMVVGKNGNTVVLAGYHATLHTITWQVGTDTNQILAVEGSVPSYSGSTEKSPDAQWDYTFTGWKDSSNTFYEDGTDLPAVTQDETYTAQYSSSARHYDIFWNNWNGTRLKSEFLAYGATPTPPETPTRAEDDDYTYEFAGWNPAVTTVTTGRAYYATFTPVPKGINYGGDNYIDPKGTQAVIDENNFGLNMNSYLNMQMLGIQLKKSIATEGGDDGVRFVTAVNSNLLKGNNIEDYGYIVAKFNANVEDLNTNMGKFTADKFEKDINVFSCNGTSNSISGDFGQYSTDTAYKYVTLSVTGTSGKSGNLVARFYVKTKDGKYHYADYINGNSETNSGMAFDLSAVEANLG